MLKQKQKENNVSFEMWIKRKNNHDRDRLHDESFMILITRHNRRLVEKLYAICNSFIVVYMRRIVGWATARNLRRLKPLSVVVGVLLPAGGRRESEIDEPHEDLS